MKFFLRILLCILHIRSTSSEWKKNHLKDTAEIVNNALTLVSKFYDRLQFDDELISKLQKDITNLVHSMLNVNTTSIVEVLLSLIRVQIYFETFNKNIKKATSLIIRSLVKTLEYATIS